MHILQLVSVEAPSRAEHCGLDQSESIHELAKRGSSQTEDPQQRSEPDTERRDENQTADEPAQVSCLRLNRSCVVLQVPSLMHVKMKLFRQLHLKQESWECVV